jgi:iron(III) transport system ATP-binding protein
MLTVKNLTKIHPHKAGQAGAGIRSASFHLESGAFFTLLGPSGCGKTTTLRCIAGLEHPDDGRIDLGGRVVFDATQHVTVPMNARDIGMVFQSYAIWPHMTVFENVAFPLKTRKRRGLNREQIRRRVEDALARVNLKGYGPREATSLSGGEQQRVAFARAIVGEPKLLLLDEPLSNLDAGLREEMRSELLRLQRTTGITTVYVTHDQIEALTLSDQIAVVNKGQILQLGSPSTIYLRPNSEFVARFVGNTNVLYGVLRSRSKEHADGRRVEIDVGWEQPIGAVIPSGVVLDGDIAVSVRPEAIEMEFAASADGGRAVCGSANSARGEVTGLTFMGQTLRYEVRVRERQFAVVTPPRSVFSVGDQVMLRFAVESTIAVPRDG